MLHISDFIFRIIKSFHNSSCIHVCFWDYKIVLKKTDTLFWRLIYFLSLIVHVLNESGLSFIHWIIMLLGWIIKPRLSCLWTCSVVDRIWAIYWSSTGQVFGSVSFIVLFIYWICWIISSWFSVSIMHRCSVDWIRLVVLTYVNDTWSGVL